METDKEVLKRKREEKDNATTYKVTTRNRYLILSDTEDDSDTETTPVQTTARVTASKPKKAIPPPPITLHDSHEHKGLVALIKENIRGTFDIKYTRQGTSVNVASAEDRIILMDTFKAKRLNFHSYTDKQVKQTSYVIRGLTKQTTAQEIIDELKEKHNIKCERCVPLKTKYWPLFMITLTEHKLEQLIKITNIDSTKITWERYTTTRRITQCHNCQMWGHATANCFADPKCLKCAGRHSTPSCAKDTTTPAKCANCGEAHPANATVCKAFVERKKWLDDRAAARATNRREQRQENYPPMPRTFAPAPATNPWTRTAPAAATIATTATTVTPRADAATDVSVFQEIAAEMQTLKSLINIKFILDQVKALNTKLKNAGTQGERNIIAVQFFINLNG